MVQPGMRVTLDAAMRARDVSRNDVENDTGDAADGDQDRGAQTASRRSAKGERRRLGKRQAALRRDDQGAGEPQRAKEDPGARRSSHSG
jgi:hypothetical protein